MWDFVALFMELLSEAERRKSSRKLGASRNSSVVNMLALTKCFWEHFPSP